LKKWSKTYYNPLLKKWSNKVSKKLLYNDNSYFCSTFSKSGKIPIFAPLFLKVEKVEEVD
jgi:hypothetical protein